MKEQVMHDGNDELIVTPADDSNIADDSDTRSVIDISAGTDDEHEETAAAAQDEQSTTSQPLADDAGSTADNVPSPAVTVDKQTRIDEAKRFFDVLFGKIPVAQFSYVLNFKGYCDSFEIADEKRRAEMARKAVENSDKGLNIWHAVNPVSVKPYYEFDEKKQKGVFKRGDADVVSYQTAIVADIDIHGEAHKATNLAADFDEAKSFLPFTPSIIVDSGYGLHAYYLFDEPLAVTDDNREEIKRRNKRLLDVIRAKAGGKKVDAVEDLPRVLRTPATFNYKLGKDNAPLCHIVEVNDIRFTPADIDTRLEALTPQLTTPARAADTKIPAVRNFENDLPLEDDDPELKAFRIRHMLPCINVVKGEYDKWVQVGMGLYNEGFSCADWEQWSRTQPEFKEGECDEKWAGFRTFNDGIKIGTLYQWAVEGGYDDKSVQREWYRLNPDKSKRHTAAQIDRLKDALRETSKDLADFDARRDAAIESLKDVETFDNNTVFADDVIEAAAFAKIYDRQSFSDLRRAVKVYGDKNKDAKVSVNDWLADVRDKAVELETRRRELSERGAALQAQITSLTFQGEDDELRGVKIPVGYEISDKGISLVDKERMIQVARRPVIIKERARDVDSENFKLILSYKEDGKWKRLPAQDTATVVDARKIVALSNKGLPVTSTTASLLINYLDSFLAENEKDLPLTYTVGRGGWHEFEGKNYFIDPRRQCVFTNTEGKRIGVEVNSNSQFAKSLRSKGTLEEWKRAYNLAKSSPVARLMVAASVAPPLLKILGERNFLLYVYAPTRAGKTTALSLGASAVGSEKIMRSFDGTANGLNGAAADVCDYPFIVDEKQVADNRLKEQLAKLVYSLANGVGRTKLNKDSTLRDLQIWRTIALMTGETQMLDDNVTGGANTRLLSIAAPKTILPADTCKVIRGIIAENYGHVMPLVVDKIIEVGKQKLRATYQTNAEFFTDKCPDVLPEHARYMAVLTLADALLNSVLGTVDANAAYDDAIIAAKSIFAFVPTAAEMDDAAREKDFVIGFIAENQNRFIKQDGDFIPDPAYGKLFDDDGYSYITVKATQEACEKGGYDYRKLVTDLVGIGFFVPSGKIKKGHKTPPKNVQKKIGKLNTDCYRIPNDALNADE